MNDQTQATYDLAGEPLTSTDQRGVSHAYTYNGDGRQTRDNVTSFACSPLRAHRQPDRHCLRRHGPRLPSNQLGHGR